VDINCFFKEAGMTYFNWRRGNSDLRTDLHILFTWEDHDKFSSIDIPKFLTVSLNGICSPLMRKGGSSFFRMKARILGYPITIACDLLGFIF
jgi:hypothetical protein